MNNMHRYERKKRAIFIDKDGTLIKNVPYNVDPARVRFQENAVAGLRDLRSMGFLLVVVSNQSGVAFGFFEEEDLQNVSRVIQYRLNGRNLRLDGFYYCPHHPEGKVKEYARICDCRKPAAGMLFRAAEDLDIDLSSSWMVGDILNDVEAGNRAGCKTILIDNGNETAWRLGRNRIPDFVARDLKEAAALIRIVNDIAEPVNFNPYVGEETCR